MIFLIPFSSLNWVRNPEESIFLLPSFFKLPNQDSLQQVAGTPPPTPLSLRQRLSPTVNLPLLGLSLFLSVVQGGRAPQVPRASRISRGKQCRGISPKARFAKPALKDPKVPHFCGKRAPIPEHINTRRVGDDAENVGCRLKTLPDPTLHR